MTALPPVRLASVVAEVPGAELRGDGDTLLADVAFDSRVVAADSLFFCVRGADTDGHDFAPDAIAAGAVAIVVERWLENDVPQVRVRSVRQAMGPISAVVFGHPARSMRLVGVTGTNGKTTTTYLLESIIREAGLVPGVIGTTGARIAGVPTPIARTTPEAPDLHRLLARMRAKRVDAIAMEASSHALDLHRLDGVVYDAALFTNLSRDHLDYHRSMEAYFATKASLFVPVAARCGIVNIDDPWGRRLYESSTIPTTTFAVNSDADLRATDVEVTPTGVAFAVGDRALRSSLLGRFNVWNCLGAFAAARALGIDDDPIVRGIAGVRTVPGRVERIDVGQGFDVMVDYAHTPDSIRSVLEGARPLASGRLIVVFGCGGDRDREKRSLMGEAATSRADLAVITSDNPRSEDPLAIIAEIEPGAKEGGGAYLIEPDRRTAIRLAMREARPGDLVVIAGKGHEPYQELATGSISFDDRQVAREELIALGAGR